MMKFILCFVLVMITNGCVTTATAPAYDPEKDVSPIKISPAYRTTPIEESKLPADTALAMAGIVRLIRGEPAQIAGLTVAPGINITEPGVPLESFSLIDLTILDRIEKEVVKGKTWTSKTMAVLTFGLGPFHALVLTEAQTSISASGVVLEKASVRSLSPAQPRVAAWFVPKKAFQDAIASNKAITVWDLMELVNSIGIPVGPGKPAAKDSYQAVAFVLDRLQPGDSVKGSVTTGPVPESSWWKSVPANAGIGFHVVMADVDGPLNVAAEEKFLHVFWRPVDSSRTGGKVLDVPVGRFSTIGTAFKTTAQAEKKSAVVTPATPANNAPNRTSQTLLDLKTKDAATAVQRRLAELGFYAGNADGAFGNASRNALARFKKAKGLGNNSNWDLPTQQALFEGASP